MKEKIMLNGQIFTVHKSKHASIENLQRYNGRWLTDCYTKPSKTKQEIFNDWLEWAYLNEVEYFGVSSYNVHRFSLQGLVEHGGHKYILHITSRYNKAYIIE